MSESLGFVFILVAIGALCFLMASTFLGPHAATHNRMSEHDKALVEQCERETSMGFEGCVETVDRDDRKTW